MHCPAGPAVDHRVLTANCIAFVQVNARKIYDEANVFSGVAANKLFTAILLGEATLQVCFDLCGALLLVAQSITPLLRKKSKRDAMCCMLHMRFCLLCCVAERSVMLSSAGSNSAVWWQVVSDSAIDTCAVGSLHRHWRC